MSNKFRLITVFLMTVLAVVLLSSCKESKKDWKEEYKEEGKINTRTYKSNYYNSGFAKAGDDYYYINLLGDDKETIYAAGSVPSKYIVDIDASYQFLEFNDYDAYSYMGMEFEKPVIDNLTVRLYDIGSDNLIKTIDVKQIILDNVGKAFVGIAPFRTISLDGKTYFGVDLVHITSKEEFLKRYNNILPSNIIITKNDILTRNTIYIDLDTEEVVFKDSMTTDWLLARSRYFDIFSLKFLQDNMQSAPFITSMYYWQDCVKLSFITDKLPENNSKLYEKFPDLKQKLEGLNGQKARLEVVLTGNPSYEDIMELIMEDGREVVFNNITISAEDSVDGLEHEVHSFDDWRQYYRLDEVDMSLVSPIFPREID